MKCLALVFSSKAPVVLLGRCMATAKGSVMYEMQSNRLDSPRSRERALLARKEALRGAGGKSPVYRQKGHCTNTGELQTLTVQEG